MSEQITVTLSREEAELLDAHFRADPSLIGRDAEQWPPWAKLRAALDTPQPAPEGEDGDWPELIEAAAAVLGEAAESTGGGG